jgi:hypothetical protein
MRSGYEHIQGLIKALAGNTPTTLTLKWSPGASESRIHEGSPATLEAWDGGRIHRMTIYAIDGGRNTVLTALGIDQDRFMVERRAPSYLGSAEFDVFVHDGTIKVLDMR